MEFWASPTSAITELVAYHDELALHSRGDQLISQTTPSDQSQLPPLDSIENDCIWHDVIESLMGKSCVRC